MATYGEVNPGRFFISVRTIDKGVEEFVEDGNPGTAATIYDTDGEMIWQGPQEKTMDFKMQRLFGQDVITYWSGETGVVGYGYGSVHILDTSYNEIYTVTLNNNFNTHDGVERDTYVDVHEHLITPQDTIILSAINISQADTSDRPDGFPDTWVIDCQFYEVNITTNEILFSWSALDHPDYLPLADSKNNLGSLGKARENPWDAFHMNSVQPVDGGYVISIRFWWSAFCVNLDGTMRWQLSGGGAEEGTIENDAQFAWQHDIRVYNETDDGLVLTVFDNHARMIGDGPSGETTGLVIDVDLDKMKGSTVRRANVAASDPSESRTQGSFQLLDYDTTGHMFMGYGSMCMFKEYDGDGKVVQMGQFGYIGHAQSYRLLKYPWKAIPYWKPEVVVQRLSQFTTDTTIYMSWNGATEHDNWRIYSVPDSDSTIDDATFLANQPRYGFETPVSLRLSEVKYIIVEARQGDKVLSTSETATVPPSEDVDE
ncbi:uncharacterized protein PFLUO_LOCUS32 [Penicillium psychrofluorescens]|uniref:uncharacterized protein n=1 Tax=Penicillium psychrofluorescens TaxID=3158075 RepID=UPI003CCCDADB